LLLTTRSSIVSVLDEVLISSALTADLFLFVGDLGHKDRETNGESGYGR
jgi:hypothetical protein